MRHQTFARAAAMTASLVLLGCVCAGESRAQTATPPASVTPTEPSPSSAVPSPAAPSPAASTSVNQPAAKGVGGLFSHKKDDYTGPTEIVELAPTPMLDEEGKQRLDPDGKPMFNAPVKQQRDKKGHPLFDDKGKPVFQTATDLGYDEHGHKIHADKVKPPKMTPVAIVGGTYTVDGVIGKAALNYDIADLKYIYLYAPGIGIAVVSNQAFAGATEQKNAFSDNTLTVNVGDHTLQLASDKRLLDKKPESAFVVIDREFALPSRFPVVGYGTVTKAPYAWPGAKAQPVMAHAAMQAPPPPANLTPVQLLKPCPAGQMRMAAPKTLPGQVAPEQPCVPIVKGTLAPAKAAPPVPKTTAASTPAGSSSGAPTRAGEPTGGASE